MVTLDLAIVGGNGDVILLDGSADYYLTAGVRGLGIPKTSVRIDPSAGDGGTWRNTRRAVREFDLPVTVLGSDRADIETKLRRLSAALSDRQAAPKLRALYSDGTSYDIEVHYTGGAETQHGKEAGGNYATWAMTFQAPDPYWTSVQASTFSLAGSNGFRGLLPELDRLLVQSSQVLGTFTVQNDGDVDAYPVWTLDGPFTNATITLNGVGWTYSAAITEGERRVIDVKAATVRDANGANKYADLGPAPKLFTFPAGISTIGITITGASNATRISGYYQPRREVLF